MPDDDTTLSPFAESPILRQVGITRRFEDKDAPTMQTWRKGRTAAYGTTKLHVSVDEGIEEEVINGVLVKHYN
jgi:hypothetical protein